VKNGFKDRRILTAERRLMACRSAKEKWAKRKGSSPFAHFIRWLYFFRTNIFLRPGDSIIRAKILSREIK
tara:strand:+ start:188 stop:397 length:210 start_codon:yes stop_codon:yes gene_type:complete